MQTTLRNLAVLFFATLAWVWPLHARAQDAGAVAGSYCLVGVMEVGSCIRLSAGGKFEYFLAYGAYDENSEGTWRLEAGRVVVDSPAYDKRPTFAFKRMQRGDGRILYGIDGYLRQNLARLRNRFFARFSEHHTQLPDFQGGSAVAVYDSGNLK